jgi:hypothetical protein
MQGAECKGQTKEGERLRRWEGEIKPGQKKEGVGFGRNYHKP